MAIYDKITYVIGIKRADGSWWFAKDVYDTREAAEKEAERLTCETGAEYTVFKSTVSFTRDEITATKNYIFPVTV